MHRFLRRSLILILAAACTSTAWTQTTAQLSAEADKAYYAKEYAKSAQLYTQLHKQNPKDLTALYNAACSLALSGQADAAFTALEELASKGYNNFEHFSSDADFTSIKSDPRWTAVSKKIEENFKKNPPRALWKKPFTALPATGAEEVRKRLGAEQDAVWLEGDILTFARRSTATSVRLTGGIQEPMTRIPDTDLWVLRLQMPGGWDKAFASYGFVEGTEFPKGFKTWRGPNAPELPKKAEKLQGQIIERKIHSAALNEERPIVVYLPPNAPAKDIPAVFLADGGACKDYATVLEPLILAGRVRPVAIVGIPSGGYSGDPKSPYDPSKDLRAKEYIHNIDPERFAAHLKFFTDEVGAYVAQEFNISTRRADRAITGFSNGGAFSAAVAFRRPDFFAVSMPLSLGIPPEDEKPSSPMPDMYFAGGLLESFGRSTTGVYEKVRGYGMKTSLDLYPAGHDQLMWQLAFATLMPKAFPPR